MAYPGHGAYPVGYDDHVKIDKAVSFALVVRRDLRMRCERYTCVRQTAVANRAPGVYPGPELHVVLQRGVAETQHERGVHQLCTRVEWVPLADVGEILLKPIQREMHRVRRQAAPHRERRFVGVGPV